MAHAPWRYVADQYEGNAEPDLALYAHYGHVLYAHKATEGTAHIDAMHAQRARRAHEQGLTVLHYHFCRPDQHASAAAEAAAFWRAVKPVYQPGDILALDCETEGGRPWVGSPDYVPNLAAAVHKASNVYPWTYGSTFFLDTVIPVSFLRKNPRWEAAYGPKPGRGRWGKPWAMWQFTDGQAGPTPHALAGIGECDISELSFRYGVPLRIRCERRRRRLVAGRRGRG